MAFSAGDLLWGDWNVEHIARHHVTPGEVEEVCLGLHLAIRVKGPRRWALYGQTDAGRYLMVVMARREAGQSYPITARDMTDAERRRYQVWRR